MTKGEKEGSKTVWSTGQATPRSSECRLYKLLKCHCPTGPVPWPAYKPAKQKTTAGQRRKNVSAAPRLIC